MGLNFSFFNTPACQLENNSSLQICDPPNFSNEYISSPICNVTCQGSNLPNPFLFTSRNVCSCSGFASLVLSLSLSPFQELTPPSAKLLESYLAQKIQIQSSRVQSIPHLSTFWGIVRSSRRV